MRASTRLWRAAEDRALVATGRYFRAYQNLRTVPARRVHPTITQPVDRYRFNSWWWL